ncbi:Pentatricopeptide repeat-containing protein [Platanthera zijinensis]|uniref:Pentatricopeptide repeat-containing protein n=1 Tax=Platanthera zijinensis TaxID=2320716 RepID=A0AAP0FYQ4_9ASPA
MARILALHRLSSPTHRHHLTHQNPLTEPSRPFPLHHAQTMEDFRKTHARFIKLGLDSITPHSGELLSAVALSTWGNLDYALSIFLHLENPCTFEFNVMIRAQVNHCQPESALQLYVKMLEQVNPDNFTFPFVLKASALLSDIRGGMQLHGHTIKFGFQDDVFIHNSLINLYGKCGRIEFSSKVFELLGPNRTVASWSSLIAAKSRVGLWVDSLHLFAKMSHESLKPDESSMTTALSSCSNLGSLDLGRSIHCSLVRNHTSLNIITLTSLLHMYMNCGQADKGMLIFESMLEKNLWTYSAAISGLAMHGHAGKALKVFSDMLRKHDPLLLPDEAIYVGVLSACSHSLMVEEGLRFFDEMRFEHQITPSEQHYGCIVDLLSRSGRLREAYEVVDSMPMEPTEATWRSILSACEINGRDIEIAESAYRELQKMGSVNAGDCVMLSKLYLDLRRWEEAADTRIEIVNRGLLQVPGFSKVEVKRKIYTFFSHDKSYSESAEVEEMIYQMEWQLRFEGFGTERMKIVEGKSQKIAIAFALLNTRSSVSAIRIFTNLRMCGDCHEYIALISKIFGREIIVRDRGRFHHFGHGSCSCGNCW